MLWVDLVCSTAVLDYLHWVGFIPFHIATDWLQSQLSNFKCHYLCYFVIIKREVANFEMVYLCVCRVDEPGAHKMQSGLPFSSLQWWLTIMGNVAFHYPKLTKDNNLISQNWRTDNKNSWSISRNVEDIISLIKKTLAWELTVGKILPGGRVNFVRNGEQLTPAIR